MSFPPKVNGVAQRLTVTSSRAGGPPQAGDVLTINLPAGFDAASFSLQQDKGSGFTGISTNQLYTLSTSDIPALGSTYNYKGVVVVSDIFSDSLASVNVTAPGAPTAVIATSLDASVSIAFTAPASNGGAAISSYKVTLSNGNIATGSSSPIVVSSPNGAAVTATVQAFNIAGYGPASAASNSVTPLPIYLGPVATRSALPNTFANSGTGLTYIQTRSKHVMQDNTTALTLVFASYYVSGANELNAAGVGTITASVEYPAGTFTQVLFSGSATGTLNSNNLVSDACGVTIPNGATFWIRNWAHWTSSKIPYFNDGLNWNFGAAAGEFCETSGTALTDKTLSGTINNTAFRGSSFRPVAILSLTQKNTAFLIGDSRARGGLSWDGNTDINGLQGELARGVGARMSYINAAVIGDWYAFATTTGAFALRAQLAQYCNTIVDEMGINDLGTSATITTAQFGDYIQKLKALVGASKPYYRSTITCRSTSTDFWYTTGNQTPVASTTSRLNFNNQIRTGQLLATDGTQVIAGYIETADAIESARNSGLFAVTNLRTCTATKAANSSTVTAPDGAFTSADLHIKLLDVPSTGGGLGQILTVTSSTQITTSQTLTLAFGPTLMGIDVPTIDGLHNGPTNELLIAASSDWNKLSA